MIADLSPGQIARLGELGVLDIPALYELCLAAPDALGALLGLERVAVAALAERCLPGLPAGYIDARQPIPPMGVIVKEEESRETPSE